MSRGGKKVWSPPKKALIGVELRVQAYADKMANCYKGTPYETVAYVAHDTVGVFREPIIERKKML